MKCKIPDSTLVWKQLDDFVVPNLALSTVDRAVYSHLLRHSRLEGHRRLHFSMAWLASGVRISTGGARPSFRRLLDRGALRLIERSRAGHLVEVFLPGEIPAAFPFSSGHRPLSDPVGTRVTRSPNIDELDFFHTDSLREAIHAREHGSCFYCLRRLNEAVRCLDHVVAQVHSGGNSYRNVVSCCSECNSRKGQTSAADFLRSLSREGRLTSPELIAGLRALKGLAAGKLRPPLPASGVLRPTPPAASSATRRTRAASAHPDEGRAQSCHRENSLQSRLPAEAAGHGFTACRKNSS
jgi:hypothetical protein